MSDETYSFEQARVRLEEIASQVRRKDTSLEKSLDLLEEGVRLANLATEQIDHTQWVVPAPEPGPDAALQAEAEHDEAQDAKAGEGETSAVAADSARDGDDVSGEGAVADDEAPAEDAEHDEARHEDA
jgi:exodeoxyribonuclease VII small subunit